MKREPSQVGLYKEMVKNICITLSIFFFEKKNFVYSLFFIFSRYFPFDSQQCVIKFVNLLRGYRDNASSGESGGLPGKHISRGSQVGYHGNTSLGGVRWVTMETHL